jgi:hypothetical protein
MASSAAACRDYDKWDPQWLKRFPGYVLAHDPTKERSWWWQHGYRLKKKSGSITKFRWVCADCVARHRPPTAVSKYSYDASTGKCIGPHLETHRIHNPHPSQPASNPQQQAIKHFFKGDSEDPQHQVFAARLAEPVNPEVLNVQIIGWLVAGNLPFRMV